MAAQNGNDKPAENSDKVVQAAQASENFSDVFNNLGPDEQKAIFQRMKSGNGAQSVNNLIISGKDTDGDGKEDTLVDAYDPVTGKDLYNRRGEQDNSAEALQARNNTISAREKDLLRGADNGDGYLTALEIENAIKTAAPGSFESRTLTMWKNFQEPIQGFHDEWGPEKGISQKDLESSQYQRFRELASRADVEKVFNSYRQSVQDMINKGERASGSGSLNAMWNNTMSKYGGDEKIRQCFDQAERVLQGLGKSPLDGKWDMHMIGELNAIGAVGMTFGGGSPGHYKVELVSKDPRDPIIVMDPWKDSFEIKDPRTFKPSGAIQPWFDHEGNATMGDFQERQDRTDRANMFKQWHTSGKPGNYSAWVKQNYPDKEHLINQKPKPLGPTSEYTLTDYAKERWDRL